MNQQEITAAFEAVKAVFPGTEMYSIQIQQENGLMAFIKFGKEDVGENTGFELLPVGEYTVQLCNHEWKSTKSGGNMLALTLEVTGPTHEGRKVFDNLNLDCASEEAQKIALRSYKSICLACNAEAFYDGIFNVDADTISDYLDALPEALYAHDIAVKIGVEKSKDAQYPDKNKITQYGTAAVTNSKPTVPAGKGKPAWAK